MNNFLKKVDKKCFDITSAIVKRWVKHKKYTQHKYDFFLMLLTWEAGYWIATVIIAGKFSLVRHTRLSDVIVSSFVFLLILAIESVQYFRIMHQKKYYDPLFENRKNPLVYETVKQTLEELFDASYNNRQIFILLNLVAMLFFGIFNPFIVPIYIVALLRIYDNYIFDFDDPEKKEKKQKDSLTDLAKRAWANLIGEFQPQD